MTSNPDPADAKKQILDDHREIGTLLATIAACEDPKAMHDCLGRLMPLLVRHFKSEEDEIDGLHANIRHRTPEQQHSLLALKDEHKQLLDRVQLLQSLAQGATAGGPKLQMLGKQLQERLAAHEAKETELFLDSIWTDIGEGD